MSKLHLPLFVLASSVSVSGCNGSDDLVINEFMASNDTTVEDEGGGTPDWIELHNPGSADQKLSGWFISDDEDELDKHALGKGLSVPAGGYLLLFADGNTEEGTDHVSFRLSKDGEDIFLSVREEGELTTIDSASFNEQETDVSMARIPNATGDWEASNQPTPEASND